MADVFLSYSHRDRRQAEVVVRRLEEAGFTVWWDRKLLKDSFEKIIEQERRKARCAVVLWSAHAVESDWVPAEAARSRSDGKLIQLRIDAEAQVPMPFDWLHILDVTDWDPEPTNEAFSDFLRAVRAEVERSPLMRTANRQIRRLWQPTRASKLRPWELLIAAVLVAAVVLVGVVWVIGYFNRFEAALWGAAVLLGWAIWLLARPLFERRLEGHLWALARIFKATTIGAVLVAVWAGGFYVHYSPPAFEDGARGFYVARFAGDRGDGEQRKFLEVLRDQIKGKGLERQLQALPLPFRVSSADEAQRVLRWGNAALLISGHRDDSRGSSGYMVELLQAPGVVSGGSSLGREVGATAEASTGRKRIRELAPAMANFFAGYTFYHRGECDAAVKFLQAASDDFDTLAADVGTQEGTVGVHESLLGTSLLFLGNCRLLLKDPKAALAAYEKAIGMIKNELGSRYIEALTNQSVVYMESGDFVKSLVPLEQGKRACLQQLWPPDPDMRRKYSPELFACSYVHHNLGVAKVLLNDPAAGRSHFEEALDLAQTAIDAGPGNQRAAMLELQAFNHQKLAWAALKEHQRNLTAGEDGKNEAGELLTTVATELGSAAALWSEAQGGPLPDGFRITQARLDVAHGRWHEARRKLDQLVDEGASASEAEIFLLLAITQVCLEEPMAAVSSVARYAAQAQSGGRDAYAGRKHFDYWRKRCKKQS